MNEVQKTYLKKLYDKHLALRAKALQAVNQSANQFLEVVDWLKNTENTTEDEISETIGENIFVGDKDAISE